MSEITNALDKLIAAAEEGMALDGATQAPLAESPSYAIETFDGFPSLYDAEPDPHGAQWLATYTNALELVQSGGIIALVGNHGAGKGRMAHEIAHKARMQNIAYPRKDWLMSHVPKIRPAIYRTAMEVFIELRSTYSPKAQSSEWEIMKAYENASLLIIDELQVRGETKFEDGKLTTIIDKRYRQKRPTILIANLTVDQLAGQLSDAINDRIRESGRIYQCNWQSYRKQTTQTK
jgi:DNA replication protein DnaC